MRGGDAEAVREDEDADAAVRDALELVTGELEPSMLCMPFLLLLLPLLLELLLLKRVPLLLP